MKRNTRLAGAMLTPVTALAVVAVISAFGSSAPRCAECTNDGGQSKFLACGTQTPSLQQQKDIEAEAAKLGGGANINAIVTIPVYFHVITNNIGEGDVSDSAIGQQIDVMNVAFAGGEAPGGFNTSYRFQLAGIDRTMNTAWYNAGINTSDEITMKSTLHQGSADDLNIYIKLSDVGGYSTFPWAYAGKPLEDGIVCPAAAMPGGSAIGHNTGDGNVHEAGHWLGLYHTFQGGCDVNNDFVNDTPAEKSPNATCPPPSNLDSCKGGGFPGKDPTMNFMDYGPEACKYQFTSGQNARMNIMYNAHRAGK